MFILIAHPAGRAFCYEARYNKAGIQTNNTGSFVDQVIWCPALEQHPLSFTLCPQKMKLVRVPVVDLAFPFSVCQSIKIQLPLWTHQLSAKKNKAYHGPPQSSNHLSLPEL